MKKCLKRETPEKTNYMIKNNIKSRKIDLNRFEKAINSHPEITKDIAKRAIQFQYNKFRKIGIKNLKSIGFNKSDIKVLSIDLPSHNLRFALLPRWIIDFLDNWWIPFNPIYVVNFQNDSDYSHDYVVAYETHSGLIDVIQTTVGPWSTGAVHCAPCWDMLGYAWSAWNPDDNVELIRTRTYSVEEINEAESIKKSCEDTWEVRIEY